MNLLVTVQDTTQKSKFFDGKSFASSLTIDSGCVQRRIQNNIFYKFLFLKINCILRPQKVIPLTLTLDIA
jgi:hypothetical protein